MSNILTSLPSKKDLDSVLPQSFSIGGFEGMTTEIANLTSGIDSNTPKGGENIGVSAAIPKNLSPDRITASLQEPLSAMSSINAGSLMSSIKGSPLPVAAGTMNFDINAPMTAIGKALSPGGQAVTPAPGSVENISGFDSEEALLQRKKLAAAGAATPMRLVNMYLKMFTSFIDTATDKDRLVELAIESLGEIYLGQIQNPEYNLPYSVVENMKGFMQSDFLQKYEKLLNDIGNSTTVDLDLVARARVEILPSLLNVQRANQTFLNFSNSSIEDLQRAIDNVLSFTGEGEVVLQQFFNSFETKVLTVLGDIKPPIETIRDAAQTIIQFLNDTADKAENAATTVSESLTGKLEGIDKFLSVELTNKINEINSQLTDFLKEVASKTDSAVGTVKGGLSSVTDGIEEFFVKVNDLKAKLESAVKDLADNVDNETKAAFALAEQKIRELLDKITEVLNGPGVKDALTKTKEGIDKFKKVIEEVSLQPVFDMVITKTGDIEVKIQAIKIEEMGVPQKTALKLGVKVVKEVKIDELIKPELLAIFKQLRDPIASLIEELKQGVLNINHIIEEFAPGTIVRNLIENAGPYKDFIALLEKYKPSVLLKPLKDANAKLTALVDKLDPDILIDKLQVLYNQLYELVDIISPEKLNKMILSSVSTVTAELKNIKDVKLDEIIQTVKQTISLKKLLEGTGIEDIADAEIWVQMKYYLGGEFLTKITEALLYVESNIAEEVKKMEFDTHKEALVKMNQMVDEQIKWTKTKMVNLLTSLHSDLTGQLTKISEMDNRRKQLLIDQSDVPVYKDLLGNLNLSQLLELDTTISAILNKNGEITNILKEFAQPLKAIQDKLKKVDLTSLVSVAPVLFKHQFADPINKIVVNIQNELKTFSDTVEAIRQIIVTLTELPAKIDEDVARILNAAVDGIKKVLASTISLINQSTGVITGTITNIHTTIVSTLDKFSPYGLLNSFALTDFETGGLDFFRSILTYPTDRTDEISFFLINKLTTEQQGILKVNNANWQSIVTEALNASVFDPRLNEKKGVAKTALDLKIAGLQGNENAKINLLTKYRSLARQLNESAIPRNMQEKIRLNRLILEAMYPDAINMSIQSMHPFIVEQISRLYPEELVQGLDVTYLNIVDNVKAMPEKLIQKPLDEKYKELKKMFFENFDIEGVFKVLQVKLDGMDEDLELGLDRISFAFNHMINTLDSRLAD
jgi:hypothetical protein